MINLSMHNAEKEKDIQWYKVSLVIFKKVRILLGFNNQVQVLYIGA